MQDILKHILDSIGEDEVVQRRLEGRCVYCGQGDNKHVFDCPEMHDRRYMYGAQFVTDPDNDYYSDKKSDM